jgi:hypothetical protein
MLSCGTVSLIQPHQNGIWVNGHQQALFKSIYFYQNTVGMLITGGNTFSIIAPTFDTCGTGVHHTSGKLSHLLYLRIKTHERGTDNRIQEARLG